MANVIHQKFLFADTGHKSNALEIHHLFYCLNEMKNEMK